MLPVLLRQLRFAGHSSSIVNSLHTSSSLFKKFRRETGFGGASNTIHKPKRNQERKAPGRVEDESWSQSLDALKFTFEIRDVHHERKEQQQSSKEPAKGDDRVLQSLLKSLHQCERFAEVDATFHEAEWSKSEMGQTCYTHSVSRIAQLVATASEEELKDGAKNLSRYFLHRFTLELTQGRLQSLSDGTRADLIHTLCIRLSHHEESRRMMDIFKDLHKITAESARTFSRHQLFKAVYGVSILPDIDSSTLVSSVVRGISSSIVNTFDPDELVWVCGLALRSPINSSHQLLPDLVSRFLDVMEGMTPGDLVVTARWLCSDRSVTFDQATLAKLDSLVAPSMDKVSHGNLCHLAHIFIQHSSTGFYPRRTSFASELLSRLPGLLDWQVVALMRVCILSEQITSPLMKEVTKFISSSEDPSYMVSATTIGFFLTGLLERRDFNLPEVPALANAVASRLDLKAEEVKYRDAIHLLRNVVRLDVGREKLVHQLFDIACSGVSHWRIIDVCILVEALHLMHSLNSVQFSLLAGQCMLRLHQNAHRYSPVLLPRNTVTVINTCRHIQGLRWDDCPWLDSFLPFMEAHFDSVLDFRNNTVSPSIVADFLSGIVSLKRPSRIIMTKVNRIVESQGVESLFRSRPKQVQAMWALAVHGSLSAKTLTSFVSKLEFKPGSMKGPLLQMASQLVAMSHMYTQHQAPSMLVGLFKSHRVHRPVMSCMSTLASIVPKGCIKLQVVTPEGLCFAACLLASDDGTLLPWSEAGIDPNCVVAREISVAGLKPIAIVVLEKNDHNLNRKELLALPEMQCQMLEQYGFTVISISLAALSVGAQLPDVEVNEKEYYRSTVIRLLKAAGIKL